MLDYNKIKYYYDNKLWTSEMVQNAVKMGKITQEECDRILSKI